MIENIAIEKLHEHPNNPRKNIGDITELAASIKESGILQNLTVVPCTGYYHGDYTVIIGHRRLAAAKAAGLTEVPCAVVEMDEKEQLSTMLLENMQRVDLSIYEQAQGIQLLLDYGETVESVAEKTGLSSSTIYRRTKLLKLDQDTFKQTEGRQVGITEYDRLFDIEDTERRNKVLASIGTANFENELNKARFEEKREKESNLIIEKLSTFARQIENALGKCYVSVVNNNNVDKLEINEGFTYCFTVESYGIYLYRDYTEAEQEQNAKENRERTEREKRNNERAEAWKVVTARLYELRINFLKTLRRSTGYVDFLVKAAPEILCKHCSTKSDDTLKMLTGVRVTDPEYKTIKEETPYFALLAVTYDCFDDSILKNCSNWDYTFRAEYNVLKEIYNFLVGLGYELSDEEKAVLDGTHELYVKKEGKE